MLVLQIQGLLTVALAALVPELEVFLVEQVHLLLELYLEGHVTVLMEVLADQNLVEEAPLEVQLRECLMILLEQLEVAAVEVVVQLVGAVTDYQDHQEILAQTEVQDHQEIQDPLRVIQQEEVKLVHQDHQEIQEHQVEQDHHKHQAIIIQE
jgi:hypothetical protein